MRKIKPHVNANPEIEINSGVKTFKRFLFLYSFFLGVFFLHEHFITRKMVLVPIKMTFMYRSFVSMQFLNQPLHVFAPELFVCNLDTAALFMQSLSLRWR